MIELDKFKQFLARRKYQDICLHNYISSAVLVPLILRKNRFSLLLTQRSEQVRDHKKQICFPGGSQEPADKDTQMTALRETYEELGISQEKIKILGRLSQHFTPTRYYITPYVGIIQSPLRLSPNPSEIENVLEIPLEYFYPTEHILTQKAEFFSQKWNLPFYHYKNYVIWGVTGRIIYELMQLLEPAQRSGDVKAKAHRS